MFTELTSKPEPGTLAPIFRLRPSSGWTRTTRTFGSRPSVSWRAKGGWGEGWEWGGGSGGLFRVLFPARRGEGRMGRGVELDGDLRRLLRHPLPGPQEERHPRPTPVVHVEPEGDVGLGDGLGAYTFLLAA